MPKPLTPAEALAFWYRAKESVVGTSIGIAPEDKRWLVNLLYKARQQSEDPDLQELIICDPPGKDEVWICHKNQEVPE